MTIRERSVGDVTIIEPEGRITIDSNAQTLLHDKVRSLLQQGRTKLVLDLRQTTYIDSAGLGEIVATYTTVTRQGGALKLLHLNARLHDLLAITKLLTVFDSFDSEAEAMASLGAATSV